MLHQLLQWHHIVSDVEAYPTTTVAGLEMNTLADGFFHAVMWFVVLAGWGIFNVVEGLVNHQVLGIHHVRDDLGAPLSWDIGFLVVSVLLIVGGLGLYRRGAASIPDGDTVDSRVDAAVDTASWGR